MKASATTNQALLMFKPDAVAMGQFGKGLRLVAGGLNSRGINFRISSPQITSVNRAFLERAYPAHIGKGWFETKFAPFMAGTHPDPLVKHAPVITAVIEAEKGPKDLYDELSMVVGPTFPEDDPTGQSVRHMLTYGIGGRTTPLYTSPVSPPYNRVHRSANGIEAAAEIAGIYGESISGTTVIPLDRFAGLCDAAAESMLMGAFGEQYPRMARELHRILACDIRRSLPLLARLNENFENNIGRTAPVMLDQSEISPASPGSCFIAIGGAPGSGKTTLAAHLMNEKGFLSPVHVTTNRHEGDSASTEEYMSVSESEFMEMLAQGELVGYTSFGELNKKHYSVLRASLESMISDGNNGVVVSGLGCLSGIQDFMLGQPQVRFGSIFVTTPELLDIVQRHQERARPGDEERYAHLESIARRFSSYPELFGRSVVNGDLDASKAEIRAYADEVSSSKESRRTDMPGWPAHVALTQYTFRRAFHNLLEKLSGIDMTNIDTIEESIHTQIEDLFRTFMEEARKSIKSRQILTEQDEKDIKLILQHTLAVFASSIQFRIPEENSLMVKRRVSKMAELADPDRTSQNLARLKRLSGKMTPVELCALPIMHDVGKLYEFFKHPVFCGTALDKYDLLDSVPGLTTEQKEMLYYGIKCHHLIGGLFTADWSLNSMRNMFAEPRATAIFRNADGSLNMERVEKQLDEILFITLCDVPGRPGKRGLRNMLIEQCFETRDRIARLARLNANNYGTFLESLSVEAKAMTSERLGLTIGMADHMMDTRNGGVSHYVGRALDSVGTALQTGKLSLADWELVKDKFYLIDEIWYSPFTLWTYIDPATGEYVDEQPEKVNMNFLTFTAWILRSLHDTGIVNDTEPSIEILALAGPDGNYLLSGEKQEPAVICLDKMIRNNVYGGAVIEDNEMFFLDASGKKIEDVKLVLSHENDRTHITIMLTGL